MKTSSYGYHHLEFDMSGFTFRERITFLVPGATSYIEYFLWPLTGCRDYVLFITSFHQTPMPSHIQNTILSFVFYFIKKAYYFPLDLPRAFTGDWSLTSSYYILKINMNSCLILYVFLIWDPGFFTYSPPQENFFCIFLQM